MRIDLQGSERDVLIISDEELIEFPDVARAKYFLSQFVGDAFNMDTLRRALREECPSTFVASLNDYQVIQVLAQRIARSVVGVVRTELPPTKSALDTDGAGASDEKVTPLEELAEKFTDPLEIIPESVVPPILIEVSLREAATIEWECKVYNLAMDLLKHNAWGGEDESDVAKILTETAKSSGGKLGEQVDASAFEMTPLGVPYDMGKKANSMVGEIMTKEVSKHGKGLTDRAGGLGDRVSDLLGGKFDKTSSALAPAMQVLVAETGSGIKGAAKGSGEKLLGLIKGAPEMGKKASKVASFLTEVTGGQGKGLVGQAMDVGDKLYELLGKPPAKEDEGAEPAPDEALPEIGFETETIDPSSVGIYLYDSNGEAQAEEAYVVTLPSGRRVKGKTGSDGRAVLKDFTPGLCKFSFPNLTVAWHEANDTPPDPQIHVVKSGDSLGKIAKKYNYVSWRPIYDHALNEEFRKKRPNPNLIHPGDEIFIPMLDENMWQGESGAVYGFCKVVPIIAPALPEPENQGSLLPPVGRLAGGMVTETVHEGDQMEFECADTSAPDGTVMAVEIYREHDDFLVDRREVKLKDGQATAEWKVPARVDGDPVAEGATAFYPVLKNEVDGFEVRGLTFRCLPEFEFGDSEGYDAPPAPKTKKETGVILRAMFRGSDGKQTWKAKRGDELVLWSRIQGLSEGALVEFHVRDADDDKPIVKLNTNMDDRWQAEKTWTIPQSVSGEIYFAVVRSGVDAEHRSGNVKIS